METPRMGYCNDCEKHDTGFMYSETFDAYYCKECNTWIDTKCSDPTCTFCTTRPKTPLNDNGEENGKASTT